MAEEVVLLDFLFSPFGMRCRIALAEKGINYEYSEQDLMNKSDLLLQMNPVHKKIPVLIHKGKPVCESLIVVEYIDEVWKEKAPLLPSDPYQRAQVRFWADYVDKKLYETGKKTSSAKVEEQEAAKKELRENLRVLEGELGVKPFFGGEKFGYIDIALVPFYHWFYVYQSFGNFSLKTEVPKLTVWYEKCLEKDSVSKSLPGFEKLNEFILERKKKLGTE